MNISYKTRNFYPDELRLLKKLKTLKENKTSGKIKLYHFFVAGLSGAGLAYITTIIPDSFWTFLFGTMAVFSFAFIVFMPYEIYKQKKKHHFFLQQLGAVIDRGTVDTCIINSQKIAIAPEFEDENDLYIIELNESEVLYMWDTEYNLHKTFPCFDFEIYDRSFFKLTGRQVYPLSGKIQPIKIDKKAKRNYVKQYGVAGPLATENINFNELLKKYNNCA